MQYFYYENGYVMDPELARATTWKEIHLSRLFHNISVLRQIAGEERIFLLPVKANAYGHGMIGIAQALQQWTEQAWPKTALFKDNQKNIDQNVNHNRDCAFSDHNQQSLFWLGVANLMEAVTLRKNNIHLPILILGPTNVSFISVYHSHQLRPTLATWEELQAWLTYAKKIGVNHPYHVKFDTGMGRLGIIFSDYQKVLQYIVEEHPFFPEGIYSHLATADEPGNAYTLNQLAKFTEIQNSFADANISVIGHIANSGGVLNYPKSHLSMIRPGIACYGYYPSAKTQTILRKQNLSLMPVMEIKSRISSAKTLPPEHGISYGRSFVTEQSTEVATVPIGYGDGLPRILSNQWPVLFNGKKFPIRGRVSMDQIVIERKNGLPATGDVVTILGKDGSAELWADVWAEYLSTISYEILCGFTSRVPMVYLEQ